MSRLIDLGNVVEVTLERLPVPDNFDGKQSSSGVKCSEIGAPCDDLPY